MSESPYSNEYIQDMLSRGLAAELYPREDPLDPRDVEKDDWIYSVIETLGLEQHELDFLDALSAGHTSSDAARMVGRSPRWGRETLSRIQDCASGH